MRPRFTISVAAHGDAEMTRRCLLLASQHAGTDRVEWLVIDNASEPPLAVTDLGSLPGLQLIRFASNRGFGEAQNHALDIAAGVYFVVLNNDVEIREPGWLDKMVRPLREDRGVALVGVTGFPCSLTREGVGYPGAEVEYAEASCLMIPTDLGRKHVLFSDEYPFAYCEDADLGLRMRKAGYRIAHVPMEVKHWVARTANAVRERFDLDGHHARNHETFRRKWADYLERRSFAREVVVRRTASLGDVIAVEPIVRAMHEREPALHITVETAFPEVFAGSPHVAATRRPSDGPVDVDLDLAYERRPTIPVVAAYAEAAGLEGEFDGLPLLRTSKEARSWAEPHAGSIVVHPGTTAWPGRNWEPSRFESVLRALGRPAVVVGDAATPALRGALDLRGQTDLARLVALLERSTLFLGIDSGPMHVAVAARIPVVAVFGAIDPALRLPSIPWVQGVHADGVPCLGCHHRRTPPQTRGACDQPSEWCMERLSVEAVLRAIGDVERAFVAFASETAKIRDRALPWCEGRGLDLGCGSDKIRPEALGIDLRESPVRDLHADVSGPLPFESGAFDYVFSSHCLEDIWDTEATLEEWVRVVRPGGRLIFYLPHPQHYRGYNADHRHQGFTQEDMAALLPPAGCRVLVNELDADGDDRYSIFVVGEKHVGT